MLFKWALFIIMYIVIKKCNDLNYLAACHTQNISVNTIYEERNCIFALTNFHGNILAFKLLNTFILIIFNNEISFRMTNLTLLYFQFYEMYRKKIFVLK